MTVERSALAAHNNAVWCNAVCTAHGHATRFSPVAWCNRQKSPPYYPNLVSLDPSAGWQTLGPTIEDLVALPALGDFGIKDSFCQLNLAPLNFGLLFDASWIWKHADAPRKKALPLHWAKVNTPSGLAAWEAAWWRSMLPSPRGTTLFPQGLLQAPAVALLAGYEANEVVAGCALTRSQNVIGVTCSFHGTAELIAAQLDMLSEIHMLYPDLPLVGYESGEDLRIAQLCGFEEIGQLRVWLRDASRVEA